MDTIDLETSCARAYAAAMAGRLALLCGAGLSMAPPSSLPSASALARDAKHKYDNEFFQVEEPLPEDIEAQAQFFFDQGTLHSHYLTRYIDPHAFASEVNDGHLAIADFLLTGHVRTGVTTNVDQLIENAGSRLKGHVEMGVNQTDVQRIDANRSPLLKIHGCWSRRDTTIWAPGQVAPGGPKATRLRESAEWLGHRLANADLLIIGYCTDWDYLNAVLERAIGQANPARVTIVDPSAPEDVRAKAPVLCALGDGAASFDHVQTSGSDYLLHLRRNLSRNFVQRALRNGREDYVTLGYAYPDDAMFELDDDIEDLWQIRRDLQGCEPSEPATWTSPADGSTIGVTILRLRRAGGRQSGPHWQFGENRIRVLNGSNKRLSAIAEAHARAQSPLVCADMTIAVGASDYGLPANIVTGGAAGNIVRAGHGTWLNEDQAAERFGW